MEEIIKQLKNDGIGVIPTDTLYGIVGSALSKKAVERIYEVKGRNTNKPFIVLISDFADLKKFGVTPTKDQNEYLKKIWPGRVSVIFPCSGKKFEYLHRGTNTLAFRFPRKNS